MLSSCAVLAVCAERLTGAAAHGGSGGTALSAGSQHCLSPQVLLEALYFSLVAKRLHPEEDDTLVEHPFVEHVSEKISKVRPPQGFALFQAKEEARKVKLLHRMLKVRHLMIPVVSRTEAECWLCELRYILVWVLLIQL